jgi:hypothetical protein
MRNLLLEQTLAEPNSSSLSFLNYLAHLNCPTAGDSNFTKINMLNSLKNQLIQATNWGSSLGTS